MSNTARPTLRIRREQPHPYFSVPRWLPRYARWPRQTDSKGNLIRILPSDMAVLMCLISYLDGDHVAYPGRARIAKDVDLSTDTVDRAIAKWEYLGLLTVDRDDLPGEGEQRARQIDTNNYIIHDTDPPTWLAVWIAEQPLALSAVLANRQTPTPEPTAEVAAPMRLGSRTHAARVAAPMRLGSRTHAAQEIMISNNDKSNNEREVVATQPATTVNDPDLAEDDQPTPPIRPAYPIGHHQRKGRLAAARPPAPASTNKPARVKKAVPSADLPNPHPPKPTNQTATEAEAIYRDVTGYLGSYRSQQRLDDFRDRQAAIDRGEYTAGDYREALARARDWVATKKAAGEKASMPGTDTLIRWINEVRAERIKIEIAEGRLSNGTTERRTGPDDGDFFRDFDFSSAAYKAPRNEHRR